MKVLDKGFVELQEVMGNDLSIVNAARVSFLGESKGDEADKKLLFYLFKNKHTTPFEMVEFKFRIKAPLFISKQWMRHRSWSYNEVSRRYTSENLDFYFPETWRMQSESNKQASSDNFPSDISFTLTEELITHCKMSYHLYEDMLNDGVAREMARMVLPQNLYTEFIGKVDAHNLLHFLRLRMDEHAQWEIRQYANTIYTEFFKPTLPWTAEAFELYG